MQFYYEFLFIISGVVSFVLYDYKCNPVIAMCASFLKTFVLCKFGPRWLNVPSMTLKPNCYLFCELWSDIFESFMTLEPDAIAMCFIHNNSTPVTLSPIAIGYVNLEWLNAASRPLSSIVVGCANYGMNSVSHITDMVQCRLDDP
jgi:hypothetical protein